MPAPLSCVRRSLLLAAAAIAVPFRAAASAVRPGSARGVYDLEASAWITKPSWVDCDQPTVDREGAAAVVSADCRTVRGAKIPRRGGMVAMEADIEYAETGQDLGACEASARVRKAGAVTLSCRVAIPDEPVLPVEVSGLGPGVSETFRLPGGTLVFETTATPDPETYASLRVNLSYGDWSFLWDTEGAATTSEVLFIEEACEAIVSTYVDGPWRVVVREAFP